MTWELPGPIELEDAQIAVRTRRVSLGHEDVAVGRDRDVVRLPRPRRLVPRARLTFRSRMRRISGVRPQVKLADPFGTSDGWSSGKGRDDVTWRG
jgi:hypothetical protein